VLRQRAQYGAAPRVKQGRTVQGPLLGRPVRNVGRRPVFAGARPGHVILLRCPYPPELLGHNMINLVGATGIEPVTARV